MIIIKKKKYDSNNIHILKEIDTKKSEKRIPSNFQPKYPKK